MRHYYMTNGNVVLAKNAGSFMTGAQDKQVYPWRTWYGKRTHGQSGQVKATVLWSCCKGKCRTASTDCPRRKYGKNTLSRQTKKTMAQRHRRLDGLQLHSMEEEDTRMVSCCRQPSEEEGRLEREREVWYGILGFTVIWIQREKRK